MNHNVTIGIVAIVAAMALTGVAFAIPQQAMAHYGHHHHNSIGVSQNISQANLCSNSTCVNSGSNSVDIDRWSNEIQES